MVYNWQNDENLSGKSDNDYVLEIIESLTMELLADPSDPRNLFLRGNGYLDLGRFGEAIDDYTKIIDSGNNLNVICSDVCLNINLQKQNTFRESSLTQARGFDYRLSLLSVSYIHLVFFE